jgi:adenylate cyclase
MKHPPEFRRTGTSAIGDVMKAILVYFVSVFVAVALAALFDAVFVLPLVEVDDALSMVNTATPTVGMIRDIGVFGLPVSVNLLFLAVYVAPILRTLTLGTASDAPSLVLTRVIRAPQAIATVALAGWTLAFLFITGIDLATLEFFVPTERVVYVVTTFAAMSASGLFIFMALFLFTDYLNRRLLIPIFFPEGRVSGRGLVKPMSFAMRLLFLWLSISVYPIVVLATGYFPRGAAGSGPVSGGLERIAWSFSLLMLPIGAFLVLSLARSFRQPVRALLEATDRIEQGDFAVDLRSDHNDELGYLIDRTAEMARGLKEKQLISDTFGKIVDPRVRDHLLQGNIALGGLRRDAAILFCDIRGFTTYSEIHGEETVVAALNEHLAAMERCIVGQGGMINKFLGDGLLALFGLPIASENPAAEAYSAARQMLEVNRQLNEKRRRRSDGDLHLGIGVHYGPVIAGTIGSPSRMEYTVIGDTVNVASRIQEYSKHYPGELFLTGAVQDRLGEAGQSNRSLGSTTLRGRQNEIGLFMYQADSHGGTKLP